MATVMQERESHELTVTRVTEDVWILRMLGPLGDEALVAFREAFRDALSCDVHDVVVDLGSVDRVNVDGAATLVVAADLMRARGGALWIAAAWQGGDGYTLRPIQESAREGLAGICAPLDDALQRVRESDARANVVRISVASRPSSKQLDASERKTT